MTWFGPVSSPGAQTLGVMTPELRDLMFEVLEETIEVLGHDVDQAYADGESSGYADWIAAIGEHLPDHIEVTPTLAGSMVAQLMRVIALQDRWAHYIGTGIPCTDQPATDLGEALYHTPPTQDGR